MCMQRLLKAVRALDRVLVERGDEDGRRRWVERARFTAPVWQRSLASSGRL
jgi:hypothetical protein